MRLAIASVRTIFSLTVFLLVIYKTNRLYDMMLQAKKAPGPLVGILPILPVVQTKNGARIGFRGRQMSEETNPLFEERLGRYHAAMATKDRRDRSPGKESEPRIVPDRPGKRHARQFVNAEFGELYPEITVTVNGVDSNFLPEGFATKLGEGNMLEISFTFPGGG